MKLPHVAAAVVSLCLAFAAHATAEPHAHASNVAVAPGITGLTATAARSADPMLEARARGWMAGLTPGWTPNRGQVAGPSGSAAGEVLYSLRTAGSQLHVTPRGLTAIFTADRERERGEGDGEGKATRTRELDWSTLEIELVGASIAPERAVAERRIEEVGEQHFYAPHCPDGVLGIPSYERVTFREVYPGIDWVLIAGDGGPVHQDFIVHPGADPDRIRIRYRGARDLELDATGTTIRMRTAHGEVSEGPLRCSQRDGASAVPARFRLAAGVVRVKVDAWDRSAPLTIDPPLLWSTLYGGSSYDGPKSIYCDNRNGDVYVVGYSASANLPCTTAVAIPNQYQQGAGAAPPDAFIWKFNQNGVRQWATYYSGNGDEYAVDCTVDRLGNLYVTGHTASTNFPTFAMAGAYNDASKSTANDIFLLKFNAQGVRQWATLYGGDSNDFAGAVTTDSLDRVYVVGYGGSTDLLLVDPGGGAYYQPALNGASDNYILKFNTLGALVWATYHGGDSGEAALGVAANGTDLYVTGLTYSTVFPTVDPPGNTDYFQAANGGSQDAFISRFTQGGIQTWSTFYGGTDFEEARWPAITPAGEVYVSGLSNSTTLPVFNPNPIATPNQPAYFQATNASVGSFDLFLLRFTPANALPWATFLGGTGNEDLGRAARSVALDSQGRVYLTGVSSSNDLPFTNPGNGAYFQNLTTGSDVVYARFAATDSLEWCTFFGGGGGSFGTAVGIGLGDCLFGTGEFQGTGFNTPAVNPPGLGAWFRTGPSGDDDGFITKFCWKTSSCCLESGCVAVTTAAECNALGGLAFHPGQGCAQVSCSILCTVCGRKFSDLNRNGVQDGGEPGLAGWTVELRDLANNIVATAITGANGDYCINSIPCGNYLVTEAAQNGWVKTAPAGAGHPLSLPLATTVNNVDFGNYACPTPPPCNPMPQGLSAWWPFDDGPGATQAVDVTHAAAGRNRLVLVNGGVGDGSGICLDAPTRYGQVPVAQQAGLEFGTGSFGVSVWVNPDNVTASGRVIVEKRGGTGTGGFAGWSLYLDGTQCVLQLTPGSAPQLATGPVLPAGVWSHVAVSVDRATGEGRWYLDGSAVPTADFVPVAGSLDNSGDLFVGQSDPSLGVAGPGLQGCLAQLALFHTPITADMAAKAAGPGPGGTPVAWCPEYAVLPASRTICATQNTAQVCFAIGNNSAAPVTFSWSLAGSTGPGCTFAGPTQFNPPAGTVTVPAGGLSPSICVTIARPNGFTQQGATSCFDLTLVNHTTGACRTRTSKLKVDNTCWCATSNPAAVAVVPAAGRTVTFAIKRPCDPIGWQTLRVVPRDPFTGAPDATTVSLAGAGPGLPFVTEVQAGGETEAMLPVQVSFPGGYDAAAIHELVLEADTDGDGEYEALASTFVMPEAGAGGTTNVPGELATPKSGVLLTAPNPFLSGTALAFTLAQAEPVSLEVYDFGGRLVRSLVRGWLEPGPRRVEWDGRDNGGRRMPPGVYFARLRTRSGTSETRLVKVQ